MSAAVALPPLEYVVRLAVDEDRPLIFDSWRKGARECPPANLIPVELFTREQHAQIERCLARGSTLVAAHPDDASEVIGYLCHGGAVDGALVVFWAWVRARPAFRRRGVGSTLLRAALAEARLPEGAPLTFTQPSREVPGSGWLGRRRELRFDPYRVRP